MKPSTSEILLSRSFLLSFFSFFFLWISFDFFILFPLYVLHVGGNSVDVGIQTAIFFFPSVVIRPIAGWFTDRIGRLKVLWFGSLLMILSGFGFLLLQGTYSETKWWMASILFCRGVGFASFYTAFFTYVVDLSLVENRARVIGLFGVSGLIAHGLAPKIGEIVLHRYEFEGFFLVSGVLSLLSLLISVFLKEKKRNFVHRQNGWWILKQVTITRRNIIILPGAFAFGYAVAGFNTFGAPYFEQSGRASVGYFFLIYGLTAGFVRIFLGGIADKYERWKLVSIFFALQAIGILLLIIPPVESFYLLAAVVAGGAHGILFPSMTAMAVDAHPEDFRGVVTSVFTGTIELGFSLGSYLQGVLVEMEGYRIMFLSASVMAFLLAVYIPLIRITGNRQYVASEALSASSFDTDQEGDT